MGSGCSAPLPDLPYKDITAISLMNKDHLVCFYAGQAELDAVRQSILNFWPLGIQNEKIKNMDPNTPDVGQPKCYSFKLNGVPFWEAGTKDQSISVRRMSAQILHRYYNLGWKLLVSSDLSRMVDVGTWFFQKQPLNPDPTPFFSIGISSYDKIRIIDCPQNLHGVIRHVAANTWAGGIQEENVEGHLYTIKFKGTPWHFVNKVESCTARWMLKDIVEALTSYGYLLYANTNLKTTADTFFFQYVPGLLAQKFTCISLNRNDRIRLIHADKAVIDVVESTAREVWAHRGGIQEVKDDRPLCYELKLKGYPWWSSGDEGVTARYLIVKMLEKMASIGLYIISGLDVTRKDNDKSVLLFRSGSPMSTIFMCLSLNDVDKLKLINAPHNVVEASKKIFALWALGLEVKPLEQLSPGCNYQVKLKGSPWSSMMSKDGYHGRALLLVCWVLLLISVGVLFVQLMSPPNTCIKTTVQIIRWTYTVGTLCMTKACSCKGNKYNNSMEFCIPPYLVEALLPVIMKQRGIECILCEHVCQHNRVLN